MTDSVRARWRTLGWRITLLRQRPCTFLLTTIPASQRPSLERLSLESESRMAAAATLTLRQLPVNWPELTDPEFLRQCRWAGTASAELTQAARSGDVAAVARVWKAELRQRRNLPALTGRCLLTTWTPVDTLDPEIQRCLQALSHSSTPSRRPTIKSAKPWLERLQPVLKSLIPADSGAEPVPVRTLLALELLWTVGHRLPQTLWWPLWKHTLVDCARLASVDIASRSIDEQLLIAGELPLLAGLVYRDLAGSREMLLRGQRWLQRELTARTDTDGTPHSELLPRLAWWLAPAVRATGWTHQAGQSVWDEDSRLLLSDLLEKTVAICRPDGQLALTHGLGADALPMLNYAADLLGWPTVSPSRQCLKSLAAASSGARGKQDAAAAISVMPSSQSDWARFALLRTDWSAAAASIAVAHHQPLPRLEVTVSGQTVLQGNWGLRLAVDDAIVELAEEWNCVCWESQPEADYVELQMSGPGNMQVERIILLSREDRFIMLADSVSGAPAAHLILETRLPLGPAMSAGQDAGQRSLRLTAPRCKVRAFPLSLPCDTVDSTPHRYWQDGQELVLEHHAEGQGLFAPVILDFAPERQRRDVHWRGLTVTEDGEVVRRDIAAAFRWQVRREQWLVYRSLKPARMPRAALGYHTGNAFAVGRFDQHGDVDPLLMVEE